MITRIGTNPYAKGVSAVKQNSSPTFRRDLLDSEKAGVIKGDLSVLAHTCYLVGQKVITKADGALETVYEMTRRYRSNVHVDALRSVIEKSV